MDCLSISSSQNEFDQYAENCDLTYDKLEHEARQQPLLQSKLPPQVNTAQETREVSNCFTFTFTL